MASNTKLPSMPPVTRVLESWHEAMLAETLACTLKSAISSPSENLLGATS